MSFYIDTLADSRHFSLNGFVAGFVGLKLQSAWNSTVVSSIRTKSSSVIKQIWFGTCRWQVHDTSSI